MRFLAASMPRRRGDGGQLVLPVWSTCSGLSGYLQYVSLVSNFLVFWPNFVQNLVEKYRDSGAENCRFWVPVLGTRSGAKIGPQIQDSLINPCIWGQFGAQNRDQKRSRKLGPKMVTKCSPPAKTDRPASEENVIPKNTKIVAQSWDQRKLRKETTCAQSPNLTVAR